MTTHFVKDRPLERGPITTPEGQRRSFGVLEALFAALATVLAVVGLAGAAPRYPDTIATIAVGAAFLFERWAIGKGGEGGAVSDRRTERGLTAESVAGWTGIVLGILSLLRVAPTVLVPIAVIVFGAGLALGAGVGTRSGRVLVGCAAIVLGVLALVQLYPRTLTLIGLLSVSAVLLLSGPLVASRMHRAVERPAT